MNLDGYLIHRTEDDQGEQFTDPLESYDERVRRLKELEDMFSGIFINKHTAKSNEIADRFKRR